MNNADRLLVKDDHTGHEDEHLPDSLFLDQAPRARRLYVAKATLLTIPTEV